MVCCKSGSALTPDQINTTIGDVKVDNLGRSRKFTPFRCGRPWFRAFHYSWVSFFLAFLGWFSIVPALEYLVDEDNDITHEVVKTSHIISVLGTIILRLAIGPVLERFGPRRVQSCLLTFGAVLVLISASINSKVSLYVIRFLISFVGAAFVPCQFWTSIMFSSEVIGQANAFAGGWGNLGGGFAHLVNGALITGFGSFLPSSVAWRYAMIIPGTVMLSVAIPMYMFSDDCPQGHWDKRLYNRTENDTNAAIDIEKEESDKGNTDIISKDYKVEKPGRCQPSSSPWLDWRVWILFCQYAACFGVELTYNNALTNYLYTAFITDECNESDSWVVDDHGEKKFNDSCSVLGRNNAAMIAGLFGLMNIFARAVGGLVSDNLSRRYLMRGRLITQLLFLSGEGVLLIIFSRMTQVGPAIAFMIFFSMFVNASCGSTYSIVPFVHAKVGVVSGIVGAGGNLGAVIWSSVLKVTLDTSDSFMYIGFAVIGLGALTLFLSIDGTGILFGDNLGPAFSDSCSEAASEGFSEHGGAAYYFDDEKDNDLNKTPVNTVDDQTLPPKTSVSHI